MAHIVKERPETQPKKKKLSKGTRILRNIVIVIVAIALLLGAAVFVLDHFGRSQLTDDGFGLFYGYDVCPVECLTCWTDGWVCGTGNLFPKENVDVYNLAKAKKTAEAMKAQEEEVWPYLHLFSKPDSNGDILWLQIIKEGLKMRGVDAGYCRLPVFSSLPEETIIRLKDTLRHFGYLD